MAVSECARNTVALSLIPRLGPRTYADYLKVFGSAEAIFKASEKAYSGVQTKARIPYSVLHDPDVFLRADAEIQKALKRGIEVLAFEDAGYPALLREIYDPPMVLYIKGCLPEAGQTLIGVVGSRACSMYGRQMTERIVSDLSRAGAVIVSGLAVGIDTIAHESALKAGGKTIAVLGGGLSKLYPPENKKLAEAIAVGGALVSEYPVDTQPMPQYFPVRNRIISGLSSAVFVAEARAKSGALITADSALEQGREVFALPGQANSEKSTGSNNLLKQGAKFVTSAEDILEGLGFSGQKVKPKQSPSLMTQNLSEEQRKVWDLLEEEPLHLDELVSATDFDLPKLMNLLSYLEMNRFVRQLPGKYFRRIES